MKAVKALLLSATVALLSGCSTYIRPPSPEASSQYRPHEAELMLELSELAYEDKVDKLKSGLRSHGLEYGASVDKHGLGYDVQAFLAFNDNYVVVAVRGSESPFASKDWINNSKVFQYKNDRLAEYCAGAGVHGGFFQSALRLRAHALRGETTIYDRVVALLAERPSRRLIFTGHSLGGATANALAVFVSYESPLKVAAVYTYGEPKTGDRGFQQCHDRVLGDRTFRFVNRNDLISRVPGWSDYVHVGNVVWFNKWGKAHTCTAKEATEAEYGELPFESFFNHRIKRYRPVIKQLGGANPFLEDCRQATAAR